MEQQTSQPERSLFANLISLVKPRIIELLLVTTVPAMILAEQGWPRLSLVISVVGFGTLAAAGANAWNSIIERDSDALMTRTAHRPLVTGELSLKISVITALVLTFTSVIGMLTLVNWQSSVLTAAAIGFYVLGYTIWLKPRTNQNIVWGGIAGCFPVLIADSAVNGIVSLNGWLLFLLIFVWTPAHYWPLAAHFREDYARVAIPMLPVDKPSSIVANWTTIYAIATAIVSTMIFPVLELGFIYIATTSIANLMFLSVCFRYVRQTRQNQEANSMTVFHLSISYLALVFLAIAVDSLVF